MKKNIIMLMVVIMLSSCNKSIDYTKKISPTEDKVSTCGRYLLLNDGTLNFDWAGTYVQTDFMGGSIAVEIADTGQDFYNVFIDDKLTKTFFVKGEKPVRMILAEGLKGGTHRLRLQKRTEASQGCCRIYGFYTVSGGVLKSVEKKKRFIEFIGDSYTCGYGTESGNTDHFQIETENCDKAFSCIIAKYFDADYALVAHSGLGMSRNYGDTKEISKGNMVERYVRTLDEEPRLIYSFNKYTPNLVVINLGTNDYSEGTTLSEKQFATNYLIMLQNVRKYYPEVPILCVIPHSANKQLISAMSQVNVMVDGFQKNGKLLKVYLAAPMPDLITFEKDTGADFHPNYNGHRKIASALIPRIASIMGWDLPAKSIE